MIWFAISLFSSMNVNLTLESGSRTNFILTKIRSWKNRKSDGLAWEDCFVQGPSLIILGILKDIIFCEICFEKYHYKKNIIIMPFLAVNLTKPPFFFRNQITYFSTNVKTKRNNEFIDKEKWHQFSVLDQIFWT